MCKAHEYLPTLHAVSVGMRRKTFNDHVTPMGNGCDVRAHSARNTMSLLLYTDVSLKGEIMSLGWVLYRVTDTLERSFLEVGSRVINIDEDDREWNGSTEGEFRALISGVRAATDYDDDVILCCVDCNSTAYKANNRLKLADDGYFNHALHSFLGRFDDWRIKEINREDNTLAHDMATISRRAIEREGAIL